MTRIAFFGYDAADAAVRRRVRGFRDDGLDVIGFMPRRQDELNVDWEHVDLGRTFDGAYAQRIASIFKGARKAAAHREQLASCDVIYARNLDMLATAFEAKRLTGLKTPVVYEALDMHRLLTRRDLIGTFFRRIEGALLKRCRLLVVSSPAFLANHFDRHFQGQFRSVLIENRLAAGGNYGPRLETPAPPRPLAIGWVGNLRCSRSLGLLTGLAAEFGDRVRIVMHGSPALTEIPDFHERVSKFANVHYLGRYKAPEDLASIYAGLDVVWAGDFMEAGFNSLWLLPNRLYEGGYYAVPPIAPAGTETARWAERHGVGFTAAEDLTSTLAELVEGLLADRSPIAKRRARLLELPDSVFVQPRGALRAMIEDAINEKPAPKRPQAVRTDAEEVGLR